MRRYGIENSFEQLQTLTRGQKITRENLQAFISSLDIPEKARNELLELTPATYLGLAQQRRKT
jgi:adenylosuccinate lyase